MRCHGPMDRFWYYTRIDGVRRRFYWYACPCGTTLPDTEWPPEEESGMNLDHIRKLERGWYEGHGPDEWEGFPFDGEALDLLESSYNEHLVGEGMPKGYAYPTPDCLVNFEWSVGRWAPSLEVNPETMLGEWHNFHLDDPTTGARLTLDEVTLNLRDPLSWQCIAYRLRELPLRTIHPVGD